MSIVCEHLKWSFIKGWATLYPVGGVALTSLWLCQRSSLSHRTMLSCGLQSPKVGGFLGYFTQEVGTSRGLVGFVQKNSNVRGSIPCFGFWGWFATMISCCSDKRNQCTVHFYNHGRETMRNRKKWKEPGAQSGSEIRPTFHHIFPSTINKNFKTIIFKQPHNQTILTHLRQTISPSTDKTQTTFQNEILNPNTLRSWWTPNSWQLLDNRT